MKPSVNDLALRGLFEEFKKEVNSSNTAEKQLRELLVALINGVITAEEAKQELEHLDTPQKLATLRKPMQKATGLAKKSMRKSG